MHLQIQIAFHLVKVYYNRRVNFHQVHIFSISVFLKTLEVYVDNLKTFIRGSSAVFRFDCVYVRDATEDPEDFYKLYIYLI